MTRSIEELQGLIAQQRGGFLGMFRRREVLTRVEQTTNAIPAPSGHDWPPMITLGSDEFRFVTSSAELSTDFRTRLETETAPQLQDLLARYDVYVTEVVGYTDEQPITVHSGSRWTRW